MQALAGQNFGYFNFEDDSIPEEINTEELIASIDRVYNSPKVILLDEIQLLPRWEQFLNKLHRRGRNLVVTGSNSRLLSGELASSLTGRHVLHELLPMSFLEFTGIAGRALPDISKAELLADKFQRYWERGGFPSVASGQENGREYLNALTDSILLRDIVHRYKLRNPRLVHGIIGVMIQELASRFSATNFSQGIDPPRPSPTTILNYLRYARDAYLLFELEPYLAKPRKRIKADRKLYVIDHALAAARNIGVSKKWGAILENIIFLELVRRGHAPNHQLFYYQADRQGEIDFLVTPNGGDPELIQSCLELSSGKTRERELNGLTLGAKQTGIKKLTIITRDEQASLQHNGFRISIVPIYKWLCGIVD